MLISELLLPEFDEEMKKTRTMLERIPADKPDFAPHPRSTPLGRLAPHVAQLPGFGLTVLTTPEFDFAHGQLQAHSPGVGSPTGQRSRRRRGPDA